MFELKIETAEREREKEKWERQQVGFAIRFPYKYWYTRTQCCSEIMPYNLYIFVS